MQLSTLARDCLYVNWAIPFASAPKLPSPLRYEVHSHEGEDWVFVSALLFRLSGLHLETVPFARLSYPQMNLRLYVLDEKGMPSVLFLRMLVPFWVAPMSRLFGRQPATSALFSYPSPSENPGEETWTWTIQRRHKLELQGRLSSPKPCVGPDLGPWEQTVAYFRDRHRGYAMWDQRLRPVRSSHPAVAIWPLDVEVGDIRLISECLSDVEEHLWVRPHSAWLCPEIPFYFELGKPIELPLPASRIPAEGLSGLRSNSRKTA